MINPFKTAFSRHVENVFAQFETLGIKVEGYVDGRLKVSVPETSNIMTGGTNLTGDIIAQMLNVYMQESGYRSDLVDVTIRMGDAHTISSIPTRNLFGIKNVYLLEEAS